jgi:hypothetical protein
MKYHYQLHGISQDLQKSVTHGRDALDACDVEGVVCPLSQRMLGYSLYERHSLLGDPADLNEAARLFETALHDCPRIALRRLLTWATSIAFNFAC